MTLFLILLPFGAFGLLMMIASTVVSLFVAAALAIVVIALDLARGRSLKLFAAGTFVVFTALGCYVALVDGDFSRQSIRFTLDASLLGIALVSIAMRAPFSLQYAREQVDAETARLPGFLHANYIITLAWIAAFVLMLVADMLMIYAPSLPLWIGVVLAFGARYAASMFTTWYPSYRRRIAVSTATQPSV